MPVRDRLKAGDKTAELRKRIATLLLKGRLAEIYKERKMAISVEGGDAKDLLRAFSKNLPFNKDLMKLLSQTFKIEQQDEQKKQKDKPEKPKPKKEKIPFNPKRYPTFFDLKTGKGSKMLTIPDGDEKTIQFSTDVENEYFDRSEDPDELKVSVLQYKTNETTGGDQPGQIENPDRLLDIRKSSPKDGSIRIGLGVTSEVKVGDELEIEAVLEGPEAFASRFWLKIVEPTQKPKEVKKPVEEDEPLMGLPDYHLVYASAPSDEPEAMTWDKLGQSDIDMDYGVVMHPLTDGDGHLEKIFINMDSTVLRNYIGKQGAIGVDQKELIPTEISYQQHLTRSYAKTRNK